MEATKLASDRCPPTEHLKLFAIGALCPHEVERVALHLSSSPRCGCHQLLSDLELHSDEFADTLGASLRNLTRAFATDDGAIGNFESICTSTSIDSNETSARKPSNSLPERIGRYRIVGLIGHGGMGEVFRARDEQLGRDVALKVVRRDRFISESAVSRFQIEAEAAAGLDHSHIVPIYEVGMAGDQHFLSMKLIDGPTLAEYANSLVDDPRRGARIVAVVAEAIHYAHQRQILHRDLKPGNILLSSTGVPYVADFGLAKRLDAESDLTHTNAIVGTPGYMAPEQAAGVPEGATTGSDVYGLGAVLYFLLTGRPPHEGASPIEICRRVVDTEPVPPRRLQPKIDRDLETICLKCLAKSPASRYVSAAAVASDLYRYLDGRSIEARAVGPVERLVRWGRRRPVMAALVASVLLLITFVGIGSPLAAVALHRQKGVADRRADEATRSLFDARLALARAERLGDRLDRRYVALEAIRGAVAASKTITVDLADLRALRNEAVGCLSLADIEKVNSWSFDGTPIRGNTESGYFAHTDGESYGIVLRRVVDFAEIARLPDLGSRPMIVRFLPGAAPWQSFINRKPTRGQSPFGSQVPPNQCGRVTTNWLRSHCISPTIRRSSSRPTATAHCSSSTSSRAD